MNLSGCRRIEQRYNRRRGLPPAHSLGLRVTPWIFNGLPLRSAMSSGSPPHSTLGFLSRAVGLPPLVGFLATGFILHAQGVTGGDILDKLSDLGITLLLFVVGLKLSLRTLARPQVWAVTGLHTSAIVVIFGFAISCACACRCSVYLRPGLLPCDAYRVRSQLFQHRFRREGA